jgi:pyrroloquinoline-quinone synthase
MSHHNEAVAALDALAREMSLLKHPFYRQWTAGGLPERLRNYAVQYYRQVAAFPHYLSPLHSRCEDLATRQTLLENLIDEERGAGNHPELWLRFGAALGLGREAPLPSGLAALYVYESQVQAVADAKIDGLKRFYGIADEDGLKFFTLHREADRYHSEAVARLIEPHGGAAPEGPMMLEAGRTAPTAMWRMLDGV